MTDVATHDRPDLLAGRVLFEPLAHWLGQSGQTLPSLDAINRLEAPRGGRPTNVRGQPVRFVAPVEEGAAYEAAVFDSGVVATRPDNWHDYFNALVWCAFPRTKAALNARHVAEIARLQANGASERGRVRDALTQFDECGMVVLGAAGQLLDGLAHHAWSEVFWRSRRELMSRTRFILFGHASYDALRQPFPGLCAKVIYLAVPEAVIQSSVSDQVALVDQWLAHYFKHADHTLSPRDFAPLPLLGIPGVVPDNQAIDYYKDVTQFRPLGARKAPDIHGWRPRVVNPL
ncbi:DUF3025 domain-containing protein [Nitrogeniibacter aestuarii]|uniref:DUF3025 domain-containing protein n=1 Tax=Nitrogeniibacter aestuarii TaxID=2815343 RepID=UPI001D0FB043|nr:DUF3025 domain-containing protein [Nitrogeniibacter aestuarii]